MTVSWIEDTNLNEFSKMAFRRHGKRGPMRLKIASDQALEL
jgi:hypothetical protein